jgi:hydrogenase maturation protease
VVERGDALQVRRLVIGIGNPDRGDDGAGRLVAELLRARVPEDVEIVESDGNAGRLLEHLERADAAYLIDASVSGVAAGTVRRFDCGATPLPSVGLQVSTHGFGVGQAIELARALGRLPPRCVVYAIEAAEVRARGRVSAVVRESTQAVADRIALELRQGSGGHASEHGLHHIRDNSLF